jgi:hypothetical protein
MPRLRRRGHQKRPNSLDPLPETISEMTLACSMASLADLQQTLHEVLTGAHDRPGNPWHSYGAKICINDELLERFKHWCRNAPPETSPEAVEQAGRDHRLPEGLRAGPLYRGTRASAATAPAHPRNEVVMPRERNGGK